MFFRRLKKYGNIGQCIDNVPGSLALDEHSSKNLNLERKGFVSVSVKYFSNEKFRKLEVNTTIRFYIQRTYIVVDTVVKTGYY